MSPQHDLDLANNSGAAFRSDLNLALEALQTNSSGASEIIDADSKAYQFWADIGSSPAVMKMRNGADNGWITLFKLDGTSLPSSSATEIAFNDAGADLDFRIEGDTEANLFFVDAGNDRIGIGNNAPVSTLDVTGAITSKTSTAGLSNQSITFTESGSGNSYGVRLGHVSNTELAFERYDGGWVETVRIDGAGRVGIGADPDNPLHVAGAGTIARLESSTTTSSLRFENSSANDGYVRYVNQDLQFITADSIAATISSTGNLGLGTTSPYNAPGYASMTLDDSTGGQIRFRNSGTEVGMLYSTGTDFNVYAFTTGVKLRFHTNGTERFVINANGKFESNSYGGGFFFYNVDSGSGTSTLKYNYTSGQMFYDTSSRLIKEDIIDCPYGIQEIKQLQPRKYFRIDDQQSEIGFIADEMREVMPEFAPLGKKSIVTKNEEDTELVPLNVNYDKLTAVLTKALQEAIAKIETLEAKVAALESA